jgi:hypothetical protein
VGVELIKSTGDACEFELITFEVVASTYSYDKHRPAICANGYVKEGSRSAQLTELGLWSLSPAITAHLTDS